MRTTTAALQANIEELQRELEESRRRQATTAKELRDRTRELTEALQQQTATANVLKVISRSTFDLNAVLATLVQSACDLCNTPQCMISLRDGGVYRCAMQSGWPPEVEQDLRDNPIPPGPYSGVGRAAISGQVVHIADVPADPDYRLPGHQSRALFRTLLSVPLLREKEVIGVFSLCRLEPDPFTQRQIELVQSFSDQAVIAIENVRLFNEVEAKTRGLGEALRQQTATADVLKVISRSAFDLKTVLRTLVQSAVDLCNASQGVIYLREGDILRSEMQLGFSPAFEKFMRENPLKPSRASPYSRAAVTGLIEHSPDVLADPSFRLFDAQKLGGFRAVLGIPLKRGDHVIGVFALGRPIPEPFTGRQIELVQRFADQAVIAIENVRLFQEVEAKTRDLSEALQQQTATADVLKAISRSAFDLDTVLVTLISTAVRLCNAGPGQIFRRDGDVYRYAASQMTVDPGYQQHEQKAEIRPDRGTLVGRVALEKRAVRIADAWSDPDYEDKDAARIGQVRAMLGVPLMREGEPIGAFALARSEPVPFSEREVELVTSFADQAVIAIENVRLFDEVQARTRDLQESLQQQTATADVLKVISRSAFDLQPVFETLISSAVELVGAFSGAISVREGAAFRYRAGAGPGYSEALQRFLESAPLALGRGSMGGRVMLSGKVEEIPDIGEDDEYEIPMASLGQPARALLGVPLLGKARVEGAFTLTLREPGRFTPRQIEIVQTFADQAVIAIENVRLFDEVQARTRDLAAALQQQTATADVLKVISRSAFDLQTVLQTLTQSAVRLCGASQGIIFLRDGDVYRAEAVVGGSAEYLQFLKEHPRRPGRESICPRVALSGVVEQIPDIAQDSEYHFPGAVKISGNRALLGVPLLRDGRVDGVFALGRSEPGAFTERQVELVQTFADQAIIAIENARLFGQVQDRTRELTRSLDDLRAAQDRLVQTEKLASLGQLTAGIAHEIKNPLNFVNNFADLSRELLGELNDVIDGAGLALDETARAEIGELTGMLKSNLEKVAQHGRRADSIVKNMLLHSREAGGERRSVDLNAVVEEALNLAYHGARAERPGFNITLGKTLDPAVGSIELFPQEFTRVLLNLISNGFYAAHRKKADGDAGFEPSLAVSTKALPARVEIRIRDNGTGIPDAVKAKMFNPFFTTKPAGEGTGLGLSLSHDIIVKQHGGTLDVETEVGEFTEFRIGLPRAGATDAAPEKRA